MGAFKKCEEPSRKMNNGMIAPEGRMSRVQRVRSAAAIDHHVAMIDGCMQNDSFDSKPMRAQTQANVASVAGQRANSANSPCSFCNLDRLRACALAAPAHNVL